MWLEGLKKENNLLNVKQGVDTKIVNLYSELEQGMSIMTTAVV